MSFTWIIIFTIFGFYFAATNGRIIINNTPGNDSTANAEEEKEYSPV